MANAVGLRNPRGSDDVTREVDGAIVPADELLELLGDEYARRILRTIADEPMGGQEIAEETGVSNATVYRRLEALERAGFVEGETVIDAGGHHYRRYRTILESVNFEVGAEGVTANVRTGCEDRSGNRERRSGNGPVRADR